MRSTTFRDAPLPEVSSHLLRSKRFESISWLKHGITSRIADVVCADGNVGFSPPRDRAVAWRNRQAWCNAVGVDPDRLVTARQVHGNGVLLADLSHARSGADPDKVPASEADAIITDVPGLPLMTLHADCQPILLVDPVRRAAGLAHAGWRGVVTDVAGTTVAAMRSAFSSTPSDVQVFLGPAIGIGCYVVGQEVIDAWEHAFDVEGARQAIRQGESAAHFDLTRANRLLLHRAGVPSENIDCADICTACSGETWFSHRGQGPSTGRFAAIMALDEGQ